MCAETANGTCKALKKLTLYRSPSRASGDGANWASPQDTKQNCGSIMKWQDMRAQLQKTRQIIVPGQMRTNLRDDDSKLVGRGKLERQLLAVFVVELLRAANGEQLYSDCGGTASRRFLLVLAHAAGENNRTFFWNIVGSSGCHWHLRCRGRRGRRSAACCCCLRRNR